jgi:NAD(P)-dependent dehydrogenase (short-subunit alcohol dehydrogenase family)
MGDNTMFEMLWYRLKIWRRIALGPVAFVFRLERAVPVSLGGVLKLDSPVAWPESPAKPQPMALSEQPRGSSGVAVIVGVGPGFGHALARRLVNENFELVMVSRNADSLAPLAQELAKSGSKIAHYGADATDELQVVDVFQRIKASHGVPALVVYAVQKSGMRPVVDVTADAFEKAWRHNCFGSFLVARAAGLAMKPVGTGTIVLIGCTSAITGRADHLNLAVGKFGQRALAQVMAREMWPLGIHVAHVLIDADIAEPNAGPSDEPKSDPDHIAQSLLALHRQPKTAWTSELDLRPWNEKFWEHC